MKTFFSKFGKYFAIVLLSLIGLCAVGVLYLFFVPNSNIFGICYISYNKNFDSSTYSVDENAINSIALNTRDYDIEVKTSPTSSKDVYVRVYSNSFGFVLKKHSQVNIDAKLLTGDLTFNISEPYGACFKNRSKITLFVPENFDVDLKLNNKNATTDINGEKLKIKNLSATTNNGEFNLNQCSIAENISVTLNRGNFTFGEKVATNRNAVELNTNTGNFYAQNVELGNVEIKSNFRAMIKIKKCVRFNLSNKSAGGSLEIGEVDELVASSSDTNISVNKINAGAVVNLSTSGKISVNEICANTTISTHDGDIYVGKVNANTIWLKTTGNGNINLNNANASVMTDTKYGNINVKFDTNSSSYSTSTNSRKLQASTTNGKVYATDVENLDVNISGNGSAEIYMSNVLGENKIETKSGDVYVQFADASSFVLNTKSDNNVANINCLQFTQIGEQNHIFSGNKTFNINTPSENGNSLTILSSSGYLKVRDFSTRETA